MTTQPDASEVPDYRGMLSLEGKAFLVAGAGQGIGRQTAHALSSAGARVLCVDLHQEPASQVAGEVGGIPFAGDMTTRDGVQSAIDAAKSEFGRLDGLVDIIGIARFKSLVETTDEDYEFQERMNLRHAYLLAQLGGKALSEQGGGSMVFIASSSGSNGAQNHAVYGALKAAVVGLAKSAAVEFGPSGVRSNSVSPGLVWTPRMSAAVGQTHHDAFANNVPLGRVALTSDIASTILFLSSGLASFVSGQNILIDGGVSAKFPYPIDLL